jgi:uncharacterized protein (TIGR02246 family)
MVRGAKDLGTKAMSKEDEQAIRDVVARWFAASQAGDTKAILDLMTDDVVFMVAGRDPFGKDEFAKTSAGMKDVKIDGKADIRELEVLGDWAFIRSHLEVTMTPPDRPPIKRSGYTLTLLRKEPDGGWRLARDANLLTPEE